MKKLFGLATIFTVIFFVFSSAAPVRGEAGSVNPAAQKVLVGKFQSRGLLVKNPEATPGKPAPALILIPGSGEFGPEEMMPLQVPPHGTDGRPLLSIFAQQFQKSGFHTLQVGKPGIDYFQSWEKFQSNYYDEKMWKSLHWNDLIANVEAALEILKNDPAVDSNKIYLLGHSEGTIVASDVAAKHPEIAGVILLGYAGENIASTLQWQVIDRQIEMVIKADIDANKDGNINQLEAKSWPETALFPPAFLKNQKWDWQAKPVVSIEEISKLWKSDLDLQKVADINFWIQRFSFWKEFATRFDAKETTASIHGDVYVFTGEFDINTPPQWSQALAKTCVSAHKNCHVEIIPNVTHKFDPLNKVPIGPKQNVVLDQGFNPTDPNFLLKLESLASQLKGQD
ncbi:MAG: alpha/beta hydrolase [Oligoflexia bacterium]|nr:alpha/beta hydrolase [Oligoflexia bacterium]